MGILSTASVVFPTGVVIDASKYPGVVLLATFLPAAPVAGGVRRIAATQIVTATVSIDFDEVLPISWMASVLRNGDIAPNQLAQPYTGVSDQFDMSFTGELVIAHQQKAWQIPSYDGSDYDVNVGFGIGLGLAAWGYSVPCMPVQTLAMDAGSYQLVRSDGEGRIGDPVPDGLEAWTMPLGFQYSLTFDQSGVGTLTKT